jgi:hypothetical protein
MLAALAVSGQTLNETERWNAGFSTVFSGVLYSTNIAIAPTNTAAVSITNSIDVTHEIYHTLQFFYTGSYTNAATAAISRTLDGTNYVTYTTITLSPDTRSTSYATNVESAFAGKWKGLRVISNLTLTNGTLQINYLGQ